jgi:hypothetical protein
LILPIAFKVAAKVLQMLFPTVLTSKISATKETGGFWRRIAKCLVASLLNQLNILFRQTALSQICNLISVFVSHNWIRWGVHAA